MYRFHSVGGAYDVRAEGSSYTIRKNKSVVRTGSLVDTGEPVGILRQAVCALTGRFAFQEGDYSSGRQGGRCLLVEVDGSLVDMVKLVGETPRLTIGQKPCAFDLLTGELYVQMGPVSEIRVWKFTPTGPKSWAKTEIDLGRHASEGIKQILNHQIVLGTDQQTITIGGVTGVDPVTDRDGAVVMKTGLGETSGNPAWRFGAIVKVSAAGVVKVWPASSPIREIVTIDLGMVAVSGENAPWPEEIEGQMVPLDQVPSAAPVVTLPVISYPSVLKPLWRSKLGYSKEIEGAEWVKPEGMKDLQILYLDKTQSVDLAKDVAKRTGAVIGVYSDSSVFEVERLNLAKKLVAEGFRSVLIFMAYPNPQGDHEISLLANFQMARNEGFECVVIRPGYRAANSTDQVVCEWNLRLTELVEAEISVVGDFNFGLDRTVQTNQWLMDYWVGLVSRTPRGKDLRKTVVVTPPVVDCHVCEEALVLTQKQLSDKVKELEGLKGKISRVPRWVRVIYGL